MKLLHIADLHIGKRLNEFNLVEDQKYIFNQVLQITEDERPDGILIAGDVYDKSQPSAEAVELLDWFLTKLTALGQPVFMISGNHDSPERLGFGSRIMEKNGLHIAGVFNGELKKEWLEDEHGIVNIYLLPFLKPAMVRPFFDNEIETYDQAIGTVISAAKINTQERNVILAHQFVVNGMQQPKRSESETLSVGGLDSVDASAFDDFDYVALGHLHGPQKIGRKTIRYAGSPLKYSFSEAQHKKSITILELGIKGQTTIRKCLLKPLHDLRKIRGPIEELLHTGQENTEHTKDYIHVTLTNEEEIYDALGQLRQVYPNLMALDFEKNYIEQEALLEIAAAGDVSEKSPMDLFALFYRIQNDKDMNSKENQIMEKIFDQAGGVGE